MKNELLAAGVASARRNSFDRANTLALLVEDNHEDMMLMRHAWKTCEMGLCLETIDRGDHAITYLRQQTPPSKAEARPAPCLMFLDLHLPGKDGFDVLRAVREESSLNALVVIVLSSSAQRSDVARAYALGANSYLVKPTTLGALVQMLHDVKTYWCQWNVFLDPDDDPGSLGCVP